VPITNAHADDVLKLFFNSTALTLPTGWRLSLHTADPGAGGSQNTSEVSYLGYTRPLVGRTATQWTVAAGPPGVWVATLQVKVEFPQVTSAVGMPVLVTHMGIGDSSSGAGRLRWRCPASLTLNNGVTPRLIEGTQLYLCACD
jgi:hypothetical protein